MSTGANRSTRLIAFSVTMLALLVTNSGSGQAVQQGSVSVEIKGAHPGKGPLRVSLWRTADSFLKGRSFRFATVDSSTEPVGVVFDGLEPGQYAVSAYQDENNNGRLDTGFLGKPKEPYGFSNDARRTFGPPSAKDAAFDVSVAGKTVSFRLK
jgi:uncharacterized protein (DUF2141 family)